MNVIAKLKNGEEVCPLIAAVNEDSSSAEASQPFAAQEVSEIY